MLASNSISIKSINIALIALFLISCSDNDSNENIYVSACASQLSNGEIVECDVDENNSRDARNTLDQILALDQNFPGPALPNPNSRERVTAVEDTTLTLESGVRLNLAGIECGTEFDSYLEATFLSEPSNEALYITTGLEADGALFAYIWEYSETLDPELGPVVWYGLLNEAGISNGWCTPVQQELHLYHDRFIEFATLF